MLIEGLKAIGLSKLCPPDKPPTAELPSWQIAMQGDQRTLAAKLWGANMRPFTVLMLLIGGSSVWLWGLYTLHHSDARQQHTNVLDLRRLPEPAAQPVQVQSQFQFQAQPQAQPQPLAPVQVAMPTNAYRTDIGNGYPGAYANPYYAPASSGRARLYVSR